MNLNIEKHPCSTLSLFSQVIKSENSKEHLENMEDIVALEALEDLPYFDISDLLGMSGVYLLYKDKALVYIGRSNNILRRIATHHTSKGWFDSVKIIPCKGIQMNCLENSLIRKLQPPHNRRLTSNEGPVMSRGLNPKKQKTWKPPKPSMEEVQKYAALAEESRVKAIQEASNNA